MEAPVMYKVMFQGSLLNDLPTELKFRILDYLDAPSLKKCRLLNKCFHKLITNCEKYNKHWILDVSHWPITPNQDFVKLYSKSSMNFGSIIGETDRFHIIPKLFQKLGKTVTCIKYLPFASMNRKQTETMIKTFDKVEYLKMHDNILICNMKRWGLVWPSVKRLSLYCGIKTNLGYNGNYSEFPNIEDIIIEYFSLLLEPALMLIKICPEKVTGLRDKLPLFSRHDPGPKFSEIENLNVKKLKIRYNSADGEDVFLPTQNEVTSYQLRTKVSHQMDHYDDSKVLPEHINLQFVRELTLELMSESPIFLSSLEEMPNLIKFGITLMPEFRYYRSTELQTCFLQYHFLESNTNVTKLELDTRGLIETCPKCIRTLISSFPKIKHLHFSTLGFKKEKDFHHFWKMINDVMKKTGISEHLITFHVGFTDYEPPIDCEEYNLFKIMTPLPNVKDVEMHMRLKKLTQKNLHMLCTKIPSVKKLDIGIENDMDFHLAGFLINQLKYLKFLRLVHNDIDFSDKEFVEHVASRDLIDTLLKVPLKLWELNVKICCETEDVYPLFEKFPTLRKLEVFKKGSTEAQNKTKEVKRTNFYDYMKSRPVLRINVNKN